jgi:hypothetical protein
MDLEVMTQFRTREEIRDSTVQEHEAVSFRRQM